MQVPQSAAADRKLHLEALDDAVVTKWPIWRSAMQGSIERTSNDKTVFEHDRRSFLSGPRGALCFMPRYALKTSIDGKIDATLLAPV
jgi:hypothetical protein